MKTVEIIIKKKFVSELFNDLKKAGVIDLVHKVKRKATRKAKSE